METGFFIFFKSWLGFEPGWSFWCIVRGLNGLITCQSQKRKYQTFLSAFPNVGHKRDIRLKSCHYRNNKNCNRTLYCIMKYIIFHLYYCHTLPISLPSSNLYNLSNYLSPPCQACILANMMMPWPCSKIFSGFASVSNNSQMFSLRIKGLNPRDRGILKATHFKTNTLENYSFLLNIMWILSSTTIVIWVLIWK